MRAKKRKYFQQLGDVIDVAHTRRSCDLRGILLVFVKFRVDVFGDLWEWIRSVFRPEKVPGIEIICLLLGRSHRNTIKLHFEAIGHECLVGPAV